MTTKPSPAEDAARSQAIQLRHAVRAHQQLVSGAQPAFGSCRADGWESEVDELEGEFELDQALGRELIARIIADDPSVASTLLGWQPPSLVERLAGAPAGPVMRAPSPRPSAQAPFPATRAWLADYLVGESPSAQVMTAKRVVEDTWSATLGVGNIAGNMVQAREAVSKLVSEHSSRAAIQHGTQAIAAGAPTTVKINEYMHLYNAYKGKAGGAPVPRIQIIGMPIEIIKPSMPNAGFRTNAKGTSVRAATLTAQQRKLLAAAAAGRHWEAHHPMGPL